VVWLTRIMMVSLFSLAGHVLGLLWARAYPTRLDIAALGITVSVILVAATAIVFGRFRTAHEEED